MENPGEIKYVDLLDEEPRWVEGLWSSQKDVEGGTILGARMLLKGLPQAVDANYTSRGDKNDLQLNLNHINNSRETFHVVFIKSCSRLI